jgi:exodeoxyribonuclease-3
MKIATYNVNGLRSAISKGFLDWLDVANPDVICLQEIKSEASQLNLEDFKSRGYVPYLFSAQKKGYSGVAILTKIKADFVSVGMNHLEYDFEGRNIRADFGDITVLSTYFPSGTTGDIRQDFKMKFLADFQKYAEELRKEKPNLIICGDYNICHRAIDIHNPVSNAKSSGFLPEEREWMEQFLNLGYTDSFRHLNKEPKNYTWWSFRAGSREKNLGWRIDYVCIANELEPRLKHAYILPEAKHSDHCPMMIELEV